MTKHIGEVIDKNLQKFPGLKKENFPNNNPSLRIYLYSYNYSINNVELKDIDNYLQIKFPQKQIIPSASMYELQYHKDLIHQFIEKY